MAGNSKKVLTILVILYLLVFVTLGVIGYLTSNDDAEHKAMASDPTHNVTYISWFRVPASFLVGNDVTWFLFPALITIVLTTFFIYRVGGAWAGLVFFSSTYFFSILGAGLYAQALATMLLLGFFAFKDLRVKAVFAFLLAFAHSTGLVLIEFAVAVSILFYLFPKIKKKYLALSCSPIFGRNTPNFFERNISLQPNTAMWGLTIKDVLSFFSKGFCFPFVIYGAKGLIKDKQYILLAMVAFGFVGAVVQSSRTLLLVIPFLAIGFGKEWQYLQHKKLWVGFMVLMAGVQWLNLFILKVVC